MRGFDPSLLPYLYGAAVLLPLTSFFVILIGAKWLGDKAAWVATAAIGGAGLLSFIVLLGFWLPSHWPESATHHGDHPAEHGDHHGDHPAEQGEHHGKPAAEHHSLQPASLPATFVALQHAENAEHESSTSADSSEHGPSTDRAAGPPYTGQYYTLGVFGPLRVTISYYIDSLTVAMFCMVTLIATLIHFYAIGYMHDELHEITDHEVTLTSGEPLRRPGRYPRFFQYLSLFCFSMLGLVLSGNIAMVFCFWELVGICSYFLIGFYVERKSASTAANKAFIVNRVGDFGMIIGLLALWSSLGTFAFGDVDSDRDGQKEPGIFSLVRPGPSHALIVPASMVAAEAPDELTAPIYADHVSEPTDELARKSSESEIASRYGRRGYGYWMLIIAGVGIFCGCVGKSAQFPLHTWLPDAMEGPTPVSALVHSATMVAAGVYLVARFYPVFAPEVLLVIAIVGCITMLLGASIAFTANDIKRVLAYSTVSQLGLMMLALGVGGWLAGAMHLVTHAFFKSLLFMCSGSVIHAVHTNDMRKMGGLFNKMPVTAVTMLIGCLAIAGVALPFVVGFAGHYSKDAILEQALLFGQRNNSAWALAFFVLALVGAFMTTTYMFRMWFMTFVGKPRDEHAYDHAHESPPVMYMPLVILAVFAVSVAWNFQLIGYGLIAAGFFIARGVQQGWFNRAGATAGLPSSAHGHDDHTGATAGLPGATAGLPGATAGLPGATAGSSSSAQHASHGDHTHGHSDHHHTPAEPPFTWPWLGAMLLCTLVGGFIIQALLPASRLDDLTLGNLLEQSRPLGTLTDARARLVDWTWPNEHDSHVDSIRIPATLAATGSWVAGILLAAIFFWWGLLSPADVRRQFAPIYNLLVNKWWFDEFYDFVFVRPVHVVSRLIAGFDRGTIDWLIDNIGRSTVWFARRWELIADQGIVDGFVNLFAGWTYSLGLSLRSVQTGRIRQYVMFIVIGAIAIFVLISFFWSPTLAK